MLLCPLVFVEAMAHNEVAGSQREQSRLIFNGPVGCYKQLAGLFNARYVTSDNIDRQVNYTT